MFGSTKSVFTATACFLGLLVFATASAHSAERRKGPYLINPDDNTAMQVLWQLDGTDTCALEWGTDTTYSLGQVTTAEYGDDHQHTYTITGLDPDTTYHYRVTMGTAQYTGSFRTPLESDATRFSFLAYGDTRSNPTMHNIVAAAMISTFTQNPAFRSLVVAVGDLVYDGRDEPDWDNQFFSEAYTNIQSFLAGVPFHNAIGNHELYGSGNYYTYMKYFPYPYVSDHYWSFDHGPAHFVMIDQYVSYDPGSPQLAWIESDLAASDKPWKFICLHEPGWSAGGHSNEIPVQHYIQPLCEQYGVPIVFGGHNHYYARAVVNGVQHITTGGGGAPLKKPDPDYPNVVVTKKCNHFCKVEIDGQYLSFTAVKHDFTVIDSFQIYNGTGGPILDIACNGQDAGVVIGSGNDVTLTIDIEARESIGEPFDIWVLVHDSQGNKKSYGPVANDPRWRKGWCTEYESGPLANLSDTVLDRPLAVGSYKAWLVLDSSANGNLNMPSIIEHDMVDFQVVP